MAMLPPSKVMVRAKIAPLASEKRKKKTKVRIKVVITGEEK